MISVFVGIIIYGVVHSILAGQRTKARFQSRFGDRAYHGLYRLFYNVFAVASIAPIFLLVIFFPGGTIWHLDLDWEPLLLIIQAIGLIGLALSLIQIDLGRFLGVSQLHAYLTGGELPLPPEALQTGGLYRLVRHPLYVFSLMVIWPVTTMTYAYFGFCVGATVYFIVGSYYEEKRMVEWFGQSYIEYQKRVPWVLPRPHTHNKR